MTQSKLHKIFFIVFFVGNIPFHLRADLTEDVDEKEKKPRAEEATKVEPVLTQPTISSPSAPLQHPSPIKENATKSPKKKPSSSAPTGAQPPVEFRGDGLSGLKSQGIIELHKNVYVEQGDFNLKADHAKIFYDETLSDVKTVFANGKVELNKIDPTIGSNVKAFGDEAEFQAQKQIVTLQGNAELYKGKDVIRGDYITYDLRTGWINAGKVKGVLQPNQNDGKK